MRLHSIACCIGALMSVFGVHSMLEQVGLLPMHLTVSEGCRYVLDVPTTELNLNLVT